MKKYEEYKDSGVEWIGEIPVYWKLKKLKYSIIIKSGNGITNEELIPNGDYNVYGGNGVLGKTNRFNTESEDLIIGRVGALCGNIHFISGKKWVSDNALYAQVKDGSCKYYEYYLKFLDLNRLANKNAQPLITGTMVREQYVGMPESLEEQTQIANYLDKKTAQIDDLIAKKEKLIELLQEEKTATINQAVTKGLDPNVPMKDSGIGWLGVIPEHWGVKRMKDILSFGTGLSITKQNLKDEGVPCVNYGEIHSKFGVVLDTEIHKLKCVDEHYINETPKAIISKGDFVFADTSEDVEGAGNFTHLRNDDEIFAGYHTVTAKPKENIDSTFFAFQFDSLDFRTQIRQSIKGIKVYSVTQSILKNTKTWIPPIDEQKQISNYLNSESCRINTLVAKYMEQISLLKEYKTALISEVVTGKVDVRDEKTQKL